jgi:hypothetical protein
MDWQGQMPFDSDSALWRMVGTLRDRGPDDEGVWQDGVCGLAHARLSIIDLSPAGAIGRRREVSLDKRFPLWSTKTQVKVVYCFG